MHPNLMLQSLPYSAYPLHLMVVEIKSILIKETKTQPFSTQPDMQSSTEAVNAFAYSSCCAISVLYPLNDLQYYMEM